MNKKQLKVFLRRIILHGYPQGSIITRYLTIYRSNNFLACDEMIKREFAKWVYL